MRKLRVATAVGAAQALTLFEQHSPPAILAEVDAICALPLDQQIRFLAFQLQHLTVYLQRERELETVSIDELRGRLGKPS